MNESDAKTSSQTEAPLAADTQQESQTPDTGGDTVSDTPASPSTASREKTPAQRAAAARKRARRMARMRPAAEVSDAIMERFPKAFFQESRERQPLAVGIHLALTESVGSDFHKLELQRFLNNYAHSLGYLHAVADKRERIDLNGEPTGEEVTDEMAAEARKEIDAIQEKRAARGDGPKRGKPKKHSDSGSPSSGPRSKPRTGFLGAGRKRHSRPVEGSAEELREQAIRQRNQRSAKIIEKKRRVTPPVSNTLLGQKLADAGLTSNDAPRKKLRLGKKSDD